VKVAWARNEAESDLIQGLLLEEGIPSSVKRQAGFDVPDMLAAGPRDIMVPEAAVEAARSLLEGTEALSPQPAGRAGEPSGPGAVSPWRLALWIGLIAAVGFVALAIRVAS
jgi:hypothetical protein